jgi:hypothetical protein
LLVETLTQERDRLDAVMRDMANSRAVLDDVIAAASAEESPTDR